jgi:hypothetical protein
MIVFSCVIAGAVLRISSCNSWLFVCIQNRNKRTIAIRPYITVIHKLRTNWLFERLHRPLTLMNKLRDLDLYLIIRCIQRSCPSAILIIFKPKKNSTDTSTVVSSAGKRYYLFKNAFSTHRFNSNYRNAKWSALWWSHLEFFCCLDRTRRKLDSFGENFCNPTYALQSCRCATKITSEVTCIILSKMLESRKVRLSLICFDVNCRERLHDGVGARD